MRGQLRLRSFGSQRQAGNLVRGLEAPLSGPGDWLPASDCLTGSGPPGKNDVSERLRPQPVKPPRARRGLLRARVPACPHISAAAPGAAGLPGNGASAAQIFTPQRRHPGHARLFTQHPTRVAALPADLRPAAEKTGKDRVCLKDVDPAVADQAWDRFLAALEPLRQAGKLGAILLQFPPWFPISRTSKEYILSCAQRVAPRRACVEFRSRTWMTPDNQKETLEFLAAHQLPYVCVDMPQGYPSSIPPVLAATATDLAVVRLHGHSTKWASKDIHERFGYRYTEDELNAWASKIRALACDTEVTHVLFNNCHRDYAQANAQQLAALLLA
jgi:uncharacterized protein YecE (DUF72 family)